MPATSNDAAAGGWYARLGLDSWLGPAFVLALLSIWRIELPFPLSRSGSMVFTVSDFVSLAMLGGLAFVFLTRRYRPSGAYRRMLVTVLAFLAWLLVVSVIRAIRGDEVLQAFLVLQTTLLPLAAYFSFDSRWENTRRALGGLAVFAAVIHLAHLGEWDNYRMSTYLGNSIVYVGLATLAIPLSVYLSATRKPTRTNAVVLMAAWINIFFGAVTPVLSGSRSMSATALVVLAVVVGLALVARKAVRTLLFCGAVAALVLGLLWMTNYRDSAMGVYRLVPAPAHVVAELQERAEQQTSASPKASPTPSVKNPTPRPTPSEPTSSATPGSALETTEQERNQSDDNRAHLRQQSIASIKRDPLIGEGVVYFPNLDNRYGSGDQAAHSFVLEHWNAYGLIGFIGYLALFVVAQLPGLRRLSPRRPGGWENWIAALTTGAVMMFSLAQPTLMITVIVMVHWITVGALRHHNAELEAAGNDS